MIRAISLLAVAALLSCDGCQDRREAAVKKQKRAPLRLWHTFNTEETRTLNSLLGRIHKAHPLLSVQPTVIPFAQAQNAFRRAAGKCTEGAPDVFRSELPWIGEFVSRGLIRPVPSHGAGESGYLPVAREAARYQGRRWILPASLDCLALLHNRALVPKPPQTLDGLIQTARQLTVDKAGRKAGDALFSSAQAVRWGFYVRADAYWFLPFLWAQGGRLLDPAAGSVYIHQPPAVAALQLYRDLIHLHRVAPPRPSPSNDYEEMMRRFGQGEVAMIVNGPWATSALLSMPAFKDASKLGIAPFPRGSTGKAAAPLSGHGFVVSRCARDQPAAWRLAQALSGLEAQVSFAKNNSLLPALEAAYHQPALRDNRLISEFKSALALSRARPHHPAMARIFDDFTPAVQAALQGDATPQEALAAVARAWSIILRPDKTGASGSHPEPGEKAAPP